MSEKKNVPKIRFPEFTEPWEQRKLGEISDKVTKKNQDVVVDEVFTNSAEYGIISQRDFFDKDIANTENIDGYYVVEPNDFVYNPRISTTAPFGPIKRNKLERSGAMSPLYYVFRPNNVDLSYLEWFFQTSCWYPFMRFNGNSGARSDRFAITDKIFNEMPISLPQDIEEQKRIGIFLTTLDTLITLHQRKLDHVKDLKKSMLQKMFPKNGQLYPEVRFPEFTDAWEQRKLGEICERITRKNKGNESDLPLTIASQYGLIDQRDFFNKVVAAKDMTNYYLLKKGEFAYNKSYSNGFDYGSIKRLNEYEKGCLSTLYVCFGITSDEVDSDYLECFFDTLNWYHDVATICAEGARNHGLLNVDIKAFFTDVKISLPLQKEEQKRIAECFQQVDHLITLHQRELDHLKLLKKGMLQQMFV